MSRLIAAVKEWFELRARVREERQFHLERAVEDLLAFGTSLREAKRTARRRLGARTNLRLAAREIGADLPGLIRLLQANRVFASAWLQPAILAVTCALILASGSNRTRVLEAIVGPQTVSGGLLFLADHGPFPRQITDSDFQALQSLATVTRVERFRNVFARAEAVPGATLDRIQSEIRTQMGHGLRVKDLGASNDASIATVAALWFLVLAAAAYSIRQSARPLIFYSLSALALHALVSALGWIYVNHLWDRFRPQGDLAADMAYAALGAALFVIGARQFFLWRSDLRLRCPECLDRLVLPLTAGDPNSIVLNPATTELICAHGHGVMLENRMSRRFRPSASTIESLFSSL